MTILLKNVKRLVSNELVSCDVLIEGKQIKEIASEITSDAHNVIDGKGHLLTPGLIDVHIHLREPGGEAKETIVTGTASAARGGFTTVCAMPNTNPVPDNVEKVRSLNEKITEDAQIRVIPYAAITEDLQGETLVNIKDVAQENVFAFTDDGVGIQEAHMMYQAMLEAAKVNKPIVAHCEDNSILYGGVCHEGTVNERLDLPGIPSICESVQIARDVLLAEAANCHYHVCHVSTKESVRVIRDAKKAGIRVTAEVSPHHLILNEDDVKTDDADFKMNPPLRSKDDQEALLEGLIDGTIDMIATDHAPHTAEEKANGFLTAPFGIVGLETAFPLLYTYLVKTGKLSLQQLVDRMTRIPAEVFQLPYGQLAENELADLTLINLEDSFTIDKNEFASKGKNTPFNDWKVKGVPVLTIFEGTIVYSDDI
ncbi:MAG TPA: dihydroorotase [Bacillota bacterium]|nr:dihydroorotase [Bacillota bacterium]